MKQRIILGVTVWYTEWNDWIEQSVLAAIAQGGTFQIGETDGTVLATNCPPVFGKALMGEMKDQHQERMKKIKHASKLKNF
jgi:hypothetical protein